MNTPYRAAFDHAANDPDSFWAEAARDLDWFKPWDRVLETDHRQFWRWFPGAETNTCHNAVDRHVAAGHGDRLALIHDSPVTDTIETWTYRDLRDAIARFAGVLAARGVSRGDRVVIYMPMVPEAVIAMLACARLGAIHSVVFGGFAAHELAVRIDDATPKAVVSASCGIEPSHLVDYKALLDSALDQAGHQPDFCVILQRPQHEAPMTAGRDIDWTEAVAGARPHDCVPVQATDPLYILYTSGTTGRPKGVVRDNGGHMVALKWTMANIYGIEPGEVWWSASDVGWVVGHSYIVYAPLLHGCTTVLYEGKPVGTPDAGAFWRVIARHKVSAMFTAPTAIRAIRREDPEGKKIGDHDLSALRTLFLAGERCDPETLNWSMDKLGIPVIDHWWQTETGWAICANPVGLGLGPIKPGSAGLPMPGWRVEVLDVNHQPAAQGDVGALAVRLPLPPGALPTLWQDEDRFVQSYLSEFPGYYATADAGFIDDDGYVHVMSRTDDIINVAGHRLSTGGIEQVLASHPDVAEAAVIGAHDALKGQLPVGLLVLKAGVDRPEADIVAEAVKLVRDEIGPVAAFKKACVVARLPKTRSGKVLRGTMKKIADHEEWRMPATIDDPAILDEINEALKKLGYS